MHEARIPSAAANAARNGPSAKSDCVIVLGNHASHAGIGDIVYSISDYFSQDYRVSTAEGVAPGKLNIIVDEFSNPYFVQFLKETKQANRGTRYVIVATEFYTPISLLGFPLGATFNFFGGVRDWASGGQIAASRLSLGIYRLPYMHRRFIGFLAALEIADAVLTIHPTILENLNAWAQHSGKPLPPNANIYPRIDLARGNRAKRLRSLPFGYAMTGSLTSYRKTVAEKLRLAFHKAGYDWPIYVHVPFGDVGRFELSGYPLENPKYLYNFNPPQKRNWPYSSPMRILRAALLGQIPVVTRKFGDHEIEQIALVLDVPLKTVAAQKLWCEATIGRKGLVESFTAAVESYNEIASRKNAAVDKACRMAGLV